MPTPQQARVNPAANVPAERQRRTNRALTQGLDALPFFAASELVIRQPAATTISSNVPHQLTIASVPVEVEIQKFEAWTDLVIDYLGSASGLVGSAGVAYTANIVEKESGAVVVTGRPLGRAAHRLSAGTTAWGHARVSGLAPTVYIVRLMVARVSANSTEIGEYDQQMFTAVEALPKPQPTFVAPED